MVSVQVLDSDGDRNNVKLNRLMASRARKRAEKCDRLVNNEMGGDVIPGDEVYIIRVAFNPLSDALIPLQIRAKDFAKNEVAIEFDLRLER